MSWARFPRFFLRFLGLRLRLALTGCMALQLSTLPPIGLPFSQRPKAEQAANATPERATESVEAL